MTPGMPKTIHGLDAFECTSAMQKAIRRCLEREAMEFACELGHTSKQYLGMVLNRLEVVAHEDIGLGDPEAVIFAVQAIELARKYMDRPEPGYWRLYVGNAIRALARAQKSREADHFQCAVGVPNQLFGRVPAIPDWALDKHTFRGRRMGRGIQHFREVGAELYPSAPADAYENEAYELWARIERDGILGSQRELL